MGKKCRIKVNLVTREVEIDGSEDFVSTYYDKIKNLLSEPPKKRSRKAKHEEPASEKKDGDAAERIPREKRVTNISVVLGIIQASKEGVSTAEIMRKTGLSVQQIWNIVSRATHEGRIKKERRGLYVAVG